MLVYIQYCNILNQILHPNHSSCFCTIARWSFAGGRKQLLTAELEQHVVNTVIANNSMTTASRNQHWQHNRGMDSIRPGVLPSGKMQVFPGLHWFYSTIMSIFFIPIEVGMSNAMKIIKKNKNIFFCISECKYILHMHVYTVFVHTHVCVNAVNNLLLTPLHTEHAKDTRQ